MEPSRFAFTFGLEDREIGALRTVTRRDAHQIFKQTGHLVEWPAGAREIRFDVLLGESHAAARELGRGAFGLVCHGVDLTERRFVCIKLVSGNGARELELHRRMRGARHVVHLLGHASVPYQSHQLCCLVMELGGLGSLWGLRGLTNHLPDVGFKQDLFFHWSRDFLRGLAALHQRGIAHFDCNLRNAVVTDDGEVKIVDLGCSQLMGGDHQVPCENADGTLDDFAPERWLGASYGETVDGRKVDSWAAGLAFLQLHHQISPPIDRRPIQELFETTPATRAARVEGMREHILEQLSRFSELTDPPNDSPWHLIKQLLTFDPTERPTPAEALSHPFFQAWESETRTPETVSRLKFLVQCDRLGSSPLRLPLVDPHYVYRPERNVLLRLLEDKESHRIALYGPSGMGKTTLAAEVARTARRHYDCVLWFHQGALEGQTIAAALELDLIEETAPYSRASDALRQFGARRRCLFVFDGHTEVAHLLGDKVSALILTGTPPAGWEAIDLGRLPDSRLLVERLLGEAPEGLCEALDHHPGRIAQACAYMRNRSASWEDYVALLPPDGETLFGTGYEPSLRALDNGAGWTLLTQLALLHPDRIEEEQIARLTDDNAPLQQLLEFDLLRDAGIGRYCMHGELRSVVRRCTHDEEALREVAEMLERSYVWNPETTDHHTQNRAVLVHAEQMASTAEHPDTQSVLASLRNMVARELWKRDTIQRACDAFGEAADLGRRGRSLSLRANALVDQGRCLLDLGRDEEALRVVTEALEHLDGERRGEALATLASAKLHLGDLHAGEQALTQASQLLPPAQQQRVHCVRAALQVARGQFQGAIGSYHRAIALGNRAQQADAQLLQSAAYLRWAHSLPEEGREQVVFIACDQLSYLVGGYRALYGDRHERVAQCLLQLSHARRLNHQPEQALEAAKEALAIIPPERTDQYRTAQHLLSLGQGQQPSLWTRIILFFLVN